VKKILQSFGFIVLGAIPLLLLFHYTKIVKIKFADSEFLLGYLGIFLGFAFSVVTFVMTLVDKGRQRVVESSIYTDLEKAETNIRMDRLNEELSDTLIFLFSSFLLVVIVMIWEAIDIPNVSIANSIWYAKPKLLSAIKFSIFGWSVYSIYDLLVASFQVSKRIDKILERTSPPN
jgi:hypothetical protein